MFGSFMSSRLILNLLILVSLIKFILASSNTTKDKLRIIGGVNVENGEFPYVVHLLLAGAQCTGIIIHEEWVLTAAHCITGSGPAQIFAGGVDFSKPSLNSVTVKSTKIIVHHCYDSHKHLDDVALIQVETPFDFSGCCVKKGRLTDGKFPGVKSMSCTAIGFGKISNDNTRNKKLHKLAVKASVLEECFRQSSYVLDFLDLHPYSYREETGQRVCAQAETGTDTCYGDSGGPLVCRGLIAGVLSYGGPKIARGPSSRGSDGKPDCAKAGKYSAYMFTGHFMKWIKYHVKDLNDTGVLNTGSTLIATLFLFTTALISLYVL